jgi:hypothetical protein
LRCPSEPDVESVHEVWAVIQVPSRKAEALLQEFLSVGHGEGENDVQEHVLELLMKVFVLVGRDCIVPRNNQYWQPVFDQLPTHLNKRIPNIEVRKDEQVCYIMR